VNFFREIFVDLVDKRLWPVAAVLVGALVIVPLVLSKSSSSTETRAAIPSPVHAADVPGQRVSLGGDQPTVSVHGKQRDPFTQQFVPKTATVTAGLGAAVAQAASSTTTPSLATTPAGVGSSGSTSSGGTGSSGSSGGSSKPTSSSGPASQVVEVKFGKAAGRLKTYKLSALNALPGNGDPILIFTGLLKDGKTAVFLVTSDATSQGDGKCSPTATVCASLLMKADQVEFLDVVDTGGTTVQYELDMQGVLHK
jgi:hypothetical protein